MNKIWLEAAASEYLAASEENVLASGGRIYETPLFAYGDACDPLFDEYKRAHIVGEGFLAPCEWLPGAKSVVSFFLPFTETVKCSNVSDRTEPSEEWLHGRWEGQIIINKLSQHLADALRNAGFEAAVPSLDSRFRGYRDLNGLPLTSSWSERHVAYICGLGTFGLSKGLITEKGIAGRFGSVVTTAFFEPSIRKYSEVYEYCTMCGACARRCPANAISVEKGKDQFVCQVFVEGTKTRYSPMYGCGKCQVAVPCQNGIPLKK